jgi:hypothetical protein
MLRVLFAAGAFRRGVALLALASLALVLDELGEVKAPAKRPFDRLRASLEAVRRKLYAICQQSCEVLHEVAIRFRIAPTHPRHH